MCAPGGRAGRGAVLALVAAATLGTLFAPAGCARRPELCGLCQRPIHAEVRTVVEFTDGRRVAACCPRCALRVAEGDGAAAANRPGTPRAGVRSLAVTDHAGGGTLSIEAAWLVDGSDETPCLRHHGPVTTGEGTSLHTCYDRCMPSLIAFRDAGAARAFVAEHGGTVQPPGARER